MTQVAVITPTDPRLMAAVAELGPKRAQMALEAFGDAEDAARSWHSCALARAYGDRRQLWDAMSEWRFVNGKPRHRMWEAMLRGTEVMLDSEVAAAVLGIPPWAAACIMKAFDSDEGGWQELRSLLTEVANGEAGRTESGAVSAPVHGGGSAGEAQGEPAHEVQWADEGGSGAGVAEESHALAGV